jgi:MFS family permease
MNLPNQNINTYNTPTSNMSEETPLKTDKQLYTTGFLQQYSDQLIHRFINLLAIAVGATVDQLGFLNASRILSINLFQLIFGRLADQYGKRVLIVAGRALNGLALLAILSVDTPSHVITLVIAASIATSMAIPSWNSLIGDYTTDTRRGEIIAQVNSIAYLGGLTAMITAFLISISDTVATTRNSYTPIMILAAVTSLLGAATALMLKEKPPAKIKNKLNITEMFVDGPLKRFLSLTFIYTLGSSIAMPLFPFIIAQKLRLTVWQVAVTSITNTLIGSISQLYIGPILDKIGRRQVLAFSRMVMASSCLVYPFATHWTHIALVEAISGLGIASWLSSQNTYIIDIAPRRLRATYLASSMAAIGVATFIGSNLGGQIVQNILGGDLAAVQTGLFVAGILRLVLGLTYMTVPETRKNEKMLP